MLIAITLALWQQALLLVTSQTIHNVSSCFVVKYDYRFGRHFLLE